MYFSVRLLDILIGKIFRRIFFNEILQMILIDNKSISIFSNKSFLIFLQHLKLNIFLRINNFPNSLIFRRSMECFPTFPIKFKKLLILIHRFSKPTQIHNLHKFQRILSDRNNFSTNSSIFKQFQHLLKFPTTNRQYFPFIKIILININYCIIFFIIYI